MMEFLLLILFCWLFFKALGLALRMAWGTAKILASLLFAVAVPLLPLALVGVAFGVLKACV